MIKLAADGTVVWLTADGRIGSTQNPGLYDKTTDAAVSFKVNAKGKVALVTDSGKLWRDGKPLEIGLNRIVDYKIYYTGAVAARDDEEHTYFFDAEAK
jgi:hypothetical protein